MSIHETQPHLRSLLVLGVMPLLVPTIAALVVAALAMVVFAVTAVDEERPRPITPRPAPSPVTDALASDDEGEVLAAIELASTSGHKLPTLVLYHPSANVVRRALAAIEPRNVPQSVVPYLEQRGLITRATHAPM